MQLNPLTLPLFACALAALWLCHWSWRRRSTPGSTAYALLLASIAGWMLANIGEKSFDSFPVKVGFANLQYFFAALTPASWYLFACRYSGRMKLAPDWLIRLLFVWPFALGFLLTIDPMTHAVRASIDLETQHVNGLGNMRVLVVHYGPVFLMHLAYAYSMFLLGGVFLLDLAVRSSPSFRIQILLLLSLMAVPLVTNALYVNGFRPLGNIDLTPFALTLVSGMGAWGFAQARVFELVPRARDAIFRDLPEAIFVTDLKCRIVDGNRCAERLADMGSVVGKPLAQVLPWIKDPLQSAADGSKGDGSGRPPFPVVRTACDGRETHWEVRITPLLEHGRSSGTMVVLSDVTERTRWERERAQLDQAVANSQKLESLGVLAGEVAHDFNNILVSILGNADLAIGESEPGTTLRRLIERIESSAEHAGRIVQQLLDYSGKRPARIRPLAIGELIESMDDMLRWAVSRTVRLEVDIEPLLPWTKGDPTQIRQVILNLVTNASDAIGDREGRVVLRASRRSCGAEELSKADFNAGVFPGDVVVIEVEDDGCGMDEQTRRQLFEPFFTTKAEGNGLGLSAVLGIIRGHRGAILVSSELGRGSRFRVFLSPSEAPSLSLDAQAPGNATPQANILVVDDEDAVRLVTELAVRQAGYRVTSVSSGEAAIARFRSNEAIDAVILDQTMPRVGGKEVLSYLRSLHSEIPVVMTSGYQEEDVLASMEPLRPDRFLRKPYRAADVILTLEEVLRSRRRMRDSEPSRESIN